MGGDAMTTTVEKTVVVQVPVATAYNQWTQFEDFPRFMDAVTSVRQLTDKRLEWVAEIGGVRRRWEADVVEQVPDRKVAWTATEGARNSGVVTFEAVSSDSTEVHLVLEYEPKDWVERVGDTLNVVENRAEKDLERFKEFIESEGHETGAWRGTLGQTSSGVAQVSGDVSAETPSTSTAPDGDDEPVFPEDRPADVREVFHEPDRTVIEPDEPR